MGDRSRVLQNFSSSGRQAIGALCVLNYNGGYEMDIYSPYL
jgi:hypothetical protein